MEAATGLVPVKQNTRKHCLPHRVWSHLGEFFANTSVHGLKYLTEPQRPLHERLIWLIGLSLSTVVFVLLLYQTWSHWRASPVIVAMDETQRPIWELPFPAVTICPETKIRSTLLNYTKIVRDYLENGEFANITDEEREVLLHLRLQCSEELTDGERGSKVNNSAIDTIEKYSMNLRNLIHVEKFGSLNTENYKLDIQPLMTEEGLCYSFNMLPADHMFNTNTFHKSRNYLRYSKNVSWSPTNGYIPGAGRNAYPYRALFSGETMGITMYLGTPWLEFESTCHLMEEGYKVQLHDPSELPQPGRHSFRVPLDSTVEVAISPFEMLTDRPRLQRYSVQQRQCYFQEERQLRYFKIYTQQNCELECIANITLQNCDCVAFYMPRAPDTLICGKIEEDCVEESIHLFQILESGLGDSDNELNETWKKRMKCNCLQSCNYIRYPSERSYANLNVASLRSLLSRFDKDEEFYISKVSIYFKDSFFVPILRMEFSSTVDFLANCGGLLGLCLGMSVLSIVEVFYWMLIRPCCTRRKIAIEEKDHSV